MVYLDIKIRNSRKIQQELEEISTSAIAEKCFNPVSFEDYINNCVK